MKKQITLLLMVLALVLLTMPLSSAIADPYADAVISYFEGPGVGDGYDNPDEALGAPEGTTAPPIRWVSLGQQGEIVLAFTDNVIVDGSGDDLTVYDLGDIENGEVFVSNDCGATFVSLGTASGTASFDLDGTGLSWANAVKVVDLSPDTTGAPYAGFDLDAVEALNSEDVELSIEKEMISGPEEIGICMPDETVYVFEITYGGPDALILDTVPAEFEVTSVVASAGSASYALATNAKGPKAVAKSATIISWLVCGGEGICATPSATLTVTIQTRLSPGKGHKHTTYKPTSCELDLELNDGAMAYQVDGECNPILVDGEMVPIVGLDPNPTPPLTVDAVCGAKPCTPTGLVVAPGATGTLELDWDEVCGGEGVVYNVYRNGELIAEGLSASEYDDEGLTTGVNYCYEVEAEYVAQVPGYESGKTDPPECETVP